MKYKIIVTEIVKFEHELIVEIPADTNIDSILDKAEKGARDLSDIEYELLNLDVKIIEKTEDDSGDPDEAEITECEKVTDDEEASEE